ncbi:hypothetical protein NJB14197_22470 [Mycobacterium montefiorense]|nr:PE-PPE domain-containing protein [Mycobacterium montefiorense]GKU56387.1 hypothetical protein NJB14197_22470 [Mycobacterium montefiorense]
MTFVITDPAAIGTAAGELRGIGAALDATNTAAAAPTTAVPPPATDSVSVRTAARLVARAEQYQVVSAQAKLFHEQFVQTLLNAQKYYAETEAENNASMAAGAATQRTKALIMGGTGNPKPDPAYMTTIQKAFLQKYPNIELVSLRTPEELWPLTGLGSRTFSRSVAEGVSALNHAVMTETLAGNKVVVMGYSQSATIASVHMRYLESLPAALRPSTQLLEFTLAANPNNPFTGGLSQGLFGFGMPGFGEFRFATPLTTQYATRIFTLGYDAVADFPKNPFWLPTGANSVFSLFKAHHMASYVSALESGIGTIQQQIGNVTMHFIPNVNLPLLDPLRMFLPTLGNPLADTLQPFLKPIVDLGQYGLLPSPLNLGGAIGTGGTAGITTGFPALAATGTPVLASTELPGLGSTGMPALGSIGMPPVGSIGMPLPPVGTELPALGSIGMPPVGSIGMPLPPVGSIGMPLPPLVPAGVASGF